MARTPALPEIDLDAVLRGDALTRDEHALEELVLAVQADAARHGAPLMSAALRAQLAATPIPVGSPRGRRRIVLAGVAGLLVGGATLGVAGAQDALPTPLQDATARAATVVGVDLPDSHEGHKATKLAGTSGHEDPKGPPSSTRSGTEPADPGTPGDHEPATPATPGNGNATRGENGDANGSENGSVNGSENGEANGSENGTGPGSSNGKGPNDNSGKASGRDKPKDDTTTTTIEADDTDG